MTTKICEVIRKPLLTEKGQILRKKDIHVLEVANWASKAHIREAAELLLSVKVKSVRTIRVPSKVKRFGRWIGSTSVKKKAYVEIISNTSNKTD